jgi:hypothetical protein
MLIHLGLTAVIAHHCPALRAIALHAIALRALTASEGDDFDEQGTDCVQVGVSQA